MKKLLLLITLIFTTASFAQVEKATEISMASPIPEIKEIYTDVWANGGSEWHN